MTTTSLGIPSRTVRTTTTRPSSAGRWFYAGTALVAVAVSFAGFAPSLIDRSARKGPLTPLVVVHATLAAAWIGLYFAQAVLVATGRLRAHKALGTASAVLAAAVVATAWETGLETARRGYDLSGDLSTAPGGPWEQSVFAFGNAFIFGALVGLALLLRRRPQAHKRLMTLALIQTLMTAPLAHFHGHWRLTAPTIPLWSVGVLVVMLLHDRRTRRRIHPASLYGGLTLIAMGAIQAFVIGPSKPWQDFVRWLAS